ncbi:MAG: PLP-dependent cysteine synthase family protein [Chitinophagaceae bacterium]
MQKNSCPIQRIKAIQTLIGNTPLLKINYRYKNKNYCIFSKAEYYNFTGSIKDRIAFYIISKSYTLGLLKQDDVIVEATSGNTGIAFSALGRNLGHKVIIFMPNWLSKERIDLIRSYGASIRLVSKEEGGFLGSMSLAEAMGKSTSNIFLPRQFDNDLNCETHYHTTAPEIFIQLKRLGLEADIFVAGVGTGGTIMGMRKYFKEQNISCNIHPIEPSNSPTLSTGCCVGKHRIQGISDEFIPSIVDLKKLDKIIQVDDGDAICMAQQFAKNMGLGLGISSGGNFLGAVKLKAANPEATVVTVFADDNKKYLSTDYVQEEPIKEYFLSKYIQLLSIESIK